MIGPGTSWSFIRGDDSRGGGWLFRSLAWRLSSCDIADTANQADTIDVFASSKKHSKAI